MCVCVCVCVCMCVRARMWSFEKALSHNTVVQKGS